MHVELNNRKNFIDKFTIAADTRTRKHQKLLWGRKKMRTVKIMAILCALVTLALSGAANANLLGTVDIVHDGFGASDTATIWGGNFYGNATAGVYILDKTDGTNEGKIWPDGLIGSFCIELHQLAPDETLTYDVVMPENVNNSFLGGTLGTARADYLSELWGRFFDLSWVSGGPYNSKQKNDAEAFATAVWEIVYEALPASPSLWDVGADGSAGPLGFRAENVDITLANSWLHALNGCGPKADLRAFVNCGKQDYLVQVPEPATLALLGIGGVLSLLRKRKRFFNSIG
jgi:hypothetical protein